MSRKRERSSNATSPALGDRVSVHDVKGTVVADLEKRSFAADYPQEDWEYLAHGYLVLDDNVGLIHVPSVDGLTNDAQLYSVPEDALSTSKGKLHSQLRKEFEAYDGRSPTILSEISVRHRHRAGFFETLIGMASDDDRMVSEGATWILKSELELGRRLNEGLSARLIAAIGDVTAWQSQLHVCQIVAYLDVPESSRDTLRQWLIIRLDADRPFLRAWALDALFRLPDGPVEALFDRMADDAAASVRARVRNLRREVAQREDKKHAEKE